MASIFVLLQRLLPKQMISRITGLIANSNNRLVKSFLINTFKRVYAVSLDEASIQNPHHFKSFNAFFTRSLLPSARPICSEKHAIVAPADGTVSQAGKISQGLLFQAKGHYYSLSALLGKDASMFEGGCFLTTYLAPNNYHRVHAPLPCNLVSTTAIPGQLFSVNGTTESALPELFVKNERLVCNFKTKCGPIAIIMVGAMLVGNIEMVWNSPQSPYKNLQHNVHNDVFNTGDELGRFLLGSTVIMCYQKGSARINQEIVSGSILRMGQKIGVYA